jgi:hypothetical protein
MLKRVLAKVRPTPASSMAVALLALVVALGSTGYAANGGAFILGLINGATQRTALGANYNGPALALSNVSTGVSATALTLTVAAGHPPMKVNAATKVTNLNADYLDGIDSARFIRRGADLTGAVSFSPPPANACSAIDLSIAGAAVGDVVILTLDGGGALPSGLLLIAEKVTSAGHVRAKVCNPTNSAVSAVTDLGVRVLTLR